MTKTGLELIEKIIEDVKNKYFKTADFTSINEEDQFKELYRSINVRWCHESHKLRETVRLQSEQLASLKQRIADLEQADPFPGKEAQEAHHKSKSATIEKSFHENETKLRQMKHKNKNVWDISQPNSKHVPAKQLGL